MRILFKLVWRDLVRNPALLVFTFAAIAAAACLATWFVATIDLQEFADDNGTRDYYGDYSLALCSERGPLPPALLAAVGSVPGVEHTSAALQAPATQRLMDFAGATVPMGRGDPPSPDLLGLSDREAPFTLRRGRWLENPGECVVGTAAADFFLRRGWHMVRLPAAVQSPLTDTYGKTPSRGIAPGDEIGVVDDRDGSIARLKVVGTFRQKFLDNRNHNETPGMFDYYGFGVGIGGRIPKKARREKPAPAKAKAPAHAASPAAPAATRPAPPRRPRSYSRKPHPPTPIFPCVYVSLADAARLTGRRPADANVLFVRLAEGNDPDAFYRGLEKRLGGPLASLGVRPMDYKVRAEDTRRMLSRGQTPDSVIGQAWSTIGIVMLASVFIIFTTLSLGVTGKTRQLAMLRTVGFTAGQVALVIVLEGLVLGLLGWAGGVASGWALVTGLLYLQTGVVPLVTLGAPALTFALACSVLGALAAAVVPAWRASRIAPADAMPVRFQRFTRRRILLALAAGIALLALIPAFVFAESLDLKFRFAVFSLLGTAAFGTAFLCLVPAAAVATERLFVRPLAALLKINHLFLQQLLTGNQWRTMGVTLSLAIGLGLFTAVYIWGFSMMSMFEISPDVPFYIMRFHEDAISPASTEFVHGLPGLKGPVMDLTVAQPEIEPALAARLKECGSSYGNVVCMGIDGEQAWGADRMVTLRFTQGSPREAREAFARKDARVVVIPTTLAHNGGLRKGDVLRLKTIRERVRPGDPRPAPGAAPDRYADYRIVGVVEFPSLWYSKSSGTRVSFRGTSAVCFAPRPSLARDFASPEGEFFWFNGDFEEDELTRKAWKVADRSLRENFARDPGRRHVLSFFQTSNWDFGLEKHHVILNSRRSMRNALLARSYRAIDRMAKMPAIILIISTIAVVNAMVVSVRSRTWEFGVMRACGTTRAALVRIVLAEALLIGICACAVSFVFGLYYAWLTTSMLDLAPVWGVIAPSVVVPWARLLPGYLFAIALAVAAAVQPAAAIGRMGIDRLLTRRDG